MADLFIIGQFEGVASTTAVSIGSQVMHMLTVMIVGLAMGTTVSIGQAVGARNRRQAAQDIGNTVTLFMAVSIALTAILLLLVRPIVSAMSTPTEAVNGTIAYQRSASSVFRSSRRITSSAPSFAGWATAKARCISSPWHAPQISRWIICLWAFSISTPPTVSQAISVVVSLIVILKRKSIVLEKSDFRPSRPVMGKILKIGVPVTLQDGFIQVSFIIITIIANRRGLADAAAVGIVEKIMSFLFLIPSSMLSTVSALGAQNIGARKPERAIQTLRCAVLLAASISFVIAVGVQFIAEPVIALFTDSSRTDGAEVIRLGGQYLRGYVWDCFFAGMQFSFSGYFCAIGRSGFFLPAQPRTG